MNFSENSTKQQEHQSDIDSGPLPHSHSPICAPTLKALEKRKSWDIWSNMTLPAMHLPGNQICCDCSSPNPDWCSLGFGILICLNCAGHHRSLGVHITLVRSVKLDSWDVQQLDHLLKGGNKLFLDYINENINDETTLIDIIKEPKLKYTQPRILYYREIFQSKLENRIARTYSDTITDPDFFPKLEIEPKSNHLSSPEWIPDLSAADCMVCMKKFSLLFLRKHHCRRW
jgi:hypothetical protein